MLDPDEEMKIFDPTEEMKEADRLRRRRETQRKYQANKRFKDMLLGIKQMTITVPVETMPRFREAAKRAREVYKAQLAREAEPYKFTPEEIEEQERLDREMAKEYRDNQR